MTLAILAAADAAVEMVLRANAAVVLTAATLMPALIVLLRRSSVCSSDEKRKMRACDRIPACPMELGGEVGDAVTCARDQSAATPTPATTPAEKH